MIASEYGLIEAHDPGAEEQAAKVAQEVDPAEIARRKDLRHIPFITIDGETARDFDDAVYVERGATGHVLWVAIADVSHYVMEGMPLDRNARERGTSVYFPERAFHMLPRALSENLCSLKPKVPRLALVARIDLDAAGRKQKIQLFEAVIESKRRAIYTEINEEFAKHGKSPKWEYTAHFELYQVLRQMRLKRGSIDFDFPEAEIVVSPRGEVISIKPRSRGESHRLIEEFMICANESVTEWMMARKWPFVYRVHDEPSSDALTKVSELAANLGVKVKLFKEVSPRALSDVVRKLEGNPAQTLLNYALLRSMKQANYSSVHGIHYGLASNAYTHFTSPIRRYPDLVVHRLIRAALDTRDGKKKGLGDKERNKLELQLADICQHCSYRERLASSAEREALKLKQVRAAMAHVGQEFEGRVVGMMEVGFFVQLTDPYIEGMVTREALADDFYVFDEVRMVFFGRRTKKTYRVGDVLRVRVVRADLDRRSIDFSLSL